MHLKLRFGRSWGVLEALEGVLEAFEVVLEAALGQDRHGKRKHWKQNEKQGFWASCRGCLGRLGGSWVRLGGSSGRLEGVLEAS